MKSNARIRRVLDAHTDLLFLIVFLITGILYLFQPTFAAVALSCIIMVALLAGGCFNLVRYFRRPSQLHGEDHSLTFGAALIVFLVACIVKPSLIMDLTALLLGLLLLAATLHLLQTGIDALRCHCPNWWLYMIAMIPALAGGLFFLLLPEQQVLLGISLLVNGVIAVALIVLRKQIDGAVLKHKTAVKEEIGEESESAETEAVDSAIEAQTVPEEPETHEAPKMPFDGPIM